MTKAPPPITPDGRYIIVRGRLWRGADPHLPKDERARLVAALMDARRAVGAALRAEDGEALRRARAAVQAAKVGLGERGSTWWGDDEDLNRHLARTTRYADWYAALEHADTRIVDQPATRPGGRARRRVPGRSSRAPSDSTD